MRHYKHPPCRHNVFIVSHKIVGSNKQIPLMGPNKPPHRGRGSILIPFVTTHTQPCRYCAFWAQRYPHDFKIQLYRRAKNFLPYPMWDIIDTPHPQCRHNVLVVSHGIVGPNRQTPFKGANKPLHRDRGSILIHFVMTHTQLCIYCVLWVQSDPHSFKTRLHS